MSVRERRLGPRALAYTYGAWLVEICLAALVAWIWRSDILGLLLLTRANEYLYALLDELTLLGLGFGWLVFVIISESWCRRLAARGTLRRKATRLAAVLVGLFGLGVLIYFLGL